MILNQDGQIANQKWQEIPVHYPQVSLDEFIIMPNHIHGILIINEKPVETQNLVSQQHNVETQNIVSLQGKNKNQFQHIIPGSVGSIIRGFKIGVTKWFRQNSDIINVRQSNFYEHIIRNDNELNRIREYIINNPLNWKNDDYNN